MKNETVLIGPQGRILDFILRTTYQDWRGLSTGSPEIPLGSHCAVRGITVNATGTRFKVMLHTGGGNFKAIHVEVLFKHDIHLLKTHVDRMRREADAAEAKGRADLLTQAAEELDTLRAGSKDPLKL